MFAREFFCGGFIGEGEVVVFADELRRFWGVDVPGVIDGKPLCRVVMRADPGGERLVGGLRQAQVGQRGAHAVKPQGFAVVAASYLAFAAAGIANAHLVEVVACVCRDGGDGFGRRGRFVVAAGGKQQGKREGGDEGFHAMIPRCCKAV